jgi:hypothetical protein
VRELYQRAGFVHDGHTEVVLLARVDELPRPSAAPVAGLEVRRSVGVNGTRLSACLGDEVIGYIEVDANLPMAVGWRIWAAGRTWGTSMCGRSTAARAWRPG